MGVVIFPRVFAVAVAETRYRNIKRASTYPVAKYHVYPQGAQPCLVFCSRIVKGSFLECCLPLAHSMALISWGEIS